MYRDRCVYLGNIVEPSIPPVVGHLRAALRSALRAQDRLALGTVRSTLAAIENASAVEGSLHTEIETGPIAKAVKGLGAADVPRRTVTEAEAIDIVRAELAERRSAAADYRRLGRSEEADRLEAEAEILDSLLATPED